MISKDKKVDGGFVAMKLIDKQILSLMITIKRTEMVEKAKYRGLTHPEVVACSQELDTLLNRYQDIA